MPNTPINFPKPGPSSPTDPDYWDDDTDTDGFEGPTNSYERVKEFHETFGHPVGDKPEVPSDDRQELRVALIFEEAIELAEAMGFNAQLVKNEVNNMLYYDGPVESHTDLVAVADALGDLDYVVNGAALEFGIDLPAVTAEVHRSNMTKLGPDGKPIYRADGKILKGEGYEPPNLEKVLFS